MTPFVGLADDTQNPFTFIVIDTYYRRAGQPVASSRQTILVRNALEAT